MKRLLKIITGLLAGTAITCCEAQPMAFAMDADGHKVVLSDVQCDAGQNWFEAAIDGKNSGCWTGLLMDTGKSAVLVLWGTKKGVVPMIYESRTFRDMPM